MLMKLFLLDYFMQKKLFSIKTKKNLLKDYQNKDEKKITFNYLNVKYHKKFVSTKQSSLCYNT